MRQKDFLQNIFQPREHLYQKDPLRLDRTCRRRVTLLRIFLRRFSENMNVNIPFLHPLFDPIAFGFIIPDITVKMMQTRSHLKPMTLAK